MLGECSRHRRPMHPQRRCDLLMRHSRLKHRFSSLQAVPSHPRPTPTNTPLSSRMGQSPACILPNRRHPQLRQHGHDPNDRFPHRRGRVDVQERLGQRPEPHPTLAQIADHVDRYSLRACQPIQCTDNKHITLTQIVQARIPRGTVLEPRTHAVVDEHPLRAGRPQLCFLRVRGLLTRRYARIPNDRHADLLRPQPDYRTP